MKIVNIEGKIYEKNFFFIMFIYVYIKKYYGNVKILLSFFFVTFF